MLLCKWFYHLVTGEDRLEYSDAQPSIDPLNEPPRHPMHVLFVDSDLEQSVGAHFRQAFGEGLVLDRQAGKVVRLKVGERPVRAPDEDTSHNSYMTRMAGLRALETQETG